MKIGLISDHDTATCGVSVRYRKVADEFRRRGHEVVAINEAHPALVDCISKRPEVMCGHGARIRAAPFLPFGDWSSQALAEFSERVGIVHPEALLNLDLERCGSRYEGLISDVVGNWLRDETPDIVIVTTQSSLGRAATAAASPSILHICFHTDYAAFYASRMLAARDRDARFFTKLHDGVVERITTQFVLRECRGYHISTLGLPPWLPGSVHEVARVFPGGVTAETETALSKVVIDGIARACATGLPIVLVSGRLTHERCIDLLPTLIAHLKGVCWLLVGDGYLASSIPWSDSVIRIPFQPYPAYRRILEVSDLFLFLGVFDTFGIGALEAIHSGLPVIAAKNAGIARHQDLIPYLTLAHVEVDKIAECVRAVLKRKATRVRPDCLLDQYSWNKLASDFVSDVIARHS